MTLRHCKISRLTFYNLYFFLHYLSCNIHNTICYTMFIFSTYFKILNIIFLQKFYMLLRYFCLLSLVTFINKAIYSILRWVLFSLFDPKGNKIIECWWICYIICNDDCIWTFIIRFCYSSKSLLTCRIPYL